jgi:hypothetical protein
MTKIGGSGSISQRHGSPDPDPHQNVMDPQHWYKLSKKFAKKEVCCMFLANRLCFLPVQGWFTVTVPIRLFKFMGGRLSC